MLATYIILDIPNDYQVLDDDSVSSGPASYATCNLCLSVMADKRGDIFLHPPSSAAFHYCSYRVMNAPNWH